MISEEVSKFRVQLKRPRFFHNGEKSLDPNYNVIIPKLSHHIIIYQLLP